MYPNFSQIIFLGNQFNWERKGNFKVWSCWYFNCWSCTWIV